MYESAWLIVLVPHVLIIGSLTLAGWAMNLRFRRRRLIHEEIVKALERGAEGEAIVQKLLAEEQARAGLRNRHVNLKAGLTLVLFGILIGVVGPAMFGPYAANAAALRIPRFLGLILDGLGLLLLGFWHFLDRPGARSDRDSK